jgi:CRISPR-associated protein Csd1
MILQALSRYYERAQNDPALDLAPLGFEWKAIPFVLVLAADGTLRRIEDTRDPSDKKSRGRQFLVPQPEKRTVGVSANLLWDTTEYVLGITRKDGKPERVLEQFADFKRRVQELPTDDAGVAAVQTFYTQFDLHTLPEQRAYASFVESNPNVAFQLETDDPALLICARPAITAWRSTSAASPENAGAGFCLVRNELAPLARLHPVIKGVWGGQSSGGSLVSFNLAAFNSFAKEQGGNAAISTLAAFNYTTALNHMLRTGSSNRLQVGDASTVFWASERSQLEEDFSLFFSDPPKDSPDQGIAAVRELLKAVDNGHYSGAKAEFYILGLAPNAARISVRFWVQAKVPELAARIAQHFKDIAIDRPSFKSEALPLWKLLASTALLGKSDNLAPALAGDTMRAVLLGTAYPQALLSAAIRRVRAEFEVPFERAALIKACLTRTFRTTQSNQEISVSLEPERPEAAYQIGRLFAALERVQSIAQPNINSTIRERYYGAASSTPASVFSILLKLKNHHLAKFESPGMKVWAERLLTEIVGRFRDFPRQLTLQDQGLFAIGYYHQTQAFFTKSSESTTSTDRTEQSL